MSLPTWTPGALSSEAVRLEGKYWRMVEAQHRVSTLKLVDTLDEQSLLEDLIEDTKPQIPLECRHLHYLLATPFRYGSVYPHGSRFRRAGKTRGVYYAAETVLTAVAEMAFYRLLFFAESPTTPWPNDAAEYTAFAAAIKCDRAIDLARPPLDRDERAWTQPTDYTACQAIADVAREAELQAIRYRSVRDHKGANIALLTCKGFAKAKPLEPQTWRIRIGSFGLQAISEFPDKRLEFSRAAFADPRLANMRWERGH
ncbi:RES family NAD+ phosphorylase [Mesorhizobium sp. VK25A]|uniref:RES family NAD+ phosphorylase n=1 Tax=Mesorhizobium vachelliae TaxID=3072309 RepID=A0ABU4ZZM2_9HYPH|nr:MULTISPECIES: RES family NAD+ phosphorylase [unclassified Mesorhizobium]MDX8529376.1 RES family NAD+ phosphorylase [Mesorhizobium sp. VK25D]MDX8545586.1 RES family NAD+ phosphorylase [Mesorhizobium sp. VK25A]